MHVFPYSEEIQLVLQILCFRTYEKLFEYQQNITIYHIMICMSTISYYQNRTIKISLRFLFEITLAVLFVIAIIAH